MQPKVPVERRNGKAVKVTIPIGDINISFILENGELCETSRMKKDGARIHGRGEEQLWVPPGAYEDALRQASAILKPTRARR